MNSHSSSSFEDSDDTDNSLVRNKGNLFKLIGGLVTLDKIMEGVFEIIEKSDPEMVSIYKERNINMTLVSKKYSYYIGC